MIEEMQKSIEGIKREISNLWGKEKNLSNRKIEKVQGLAVKNINELKKKGEFSEKEIIEIAENLEMHIFKLMTDSISEFLGEVTGSIQNLLSKENRGENQSKLIEEKKGILLSLKNWIGKTDLDQERKIRNWIDNFIKENLEVN